MGDLAGHDIILLLDQYHPNTITEIRMSAVSNSYTTCIYNETLSQMHEGLREGSKCSPYIMKSTEVQTLGTI